MNETHLHHDCGECSSQQWQKLSSGYYVFGDQKPDSISTKLSSYQSISLSSYSTNFNVHDSLAFRSSASTAMAKNLEFPDNY